MKKTIRQYCFYDSGNTNNNPRNITKESLTSGSIFFKDSTLGNITQLGIQSLPGTKFYLNNSITPVIIGFTGIYELDLKDEAEITMLSFDSGSIDRIMETSSAFLIVDAIYEVEE